MSLFSNSNSNSSSPSSGLFGNSTNQASQGSGLFGNSVPHRSGLFGNSTNQGSGLFGTSSNRAPGLFGDFRNQASQGSGLFGAAEDKVLTDPQCPKGHELIRTFDLQRRYRDDGTLYSRNEYNCDLCRASRLDARKYPVAHCHLCSFDICPNCVDISSTPVKCDQSHRLFQLKSQSSMFDKRDYKCKGCQESFRGRKNHLMGCPLCDFYLCPPCLKDRTPDQPEDQDKTKVEPIIRPENGCSGCKEAKKTHLLLPCGHVCACNNCSKDLVEKEGECPECKTQVEKRIKVF